MPYMLPLLLVLIAGALATENRDIVRCTEIAFSKAAETRDVQRFSTFIDADARFIGASVAHGVDEITTAWAPFFAATGPAIRWRPQFIEVLENGMYAFSRGPYRITTVDENGDAAEMWGTFNSVWRRNPDGRWRVVFDAGSAPDENPTDEQRSLLESENEECDAQER